MKQKVKIIGIKSMLILSALVCCSCVSNPLSLPDSSSEDSVGEKLVEENTYEENTRERGQEESDSDVWECQLDNQWVGDITDETKGEFLEHFMGVGAAEAEPFYIFYGKESAWMNAEGKVQLELYYNEAAGIMCGIRYIYSQEDSGEPQVSMKGFADLDISVFDEWDYSGEAVFSVQKNGSDGSESVEDYEEMYTYNEAGQPVHFESTGTIDWLQEEPEPSTIIQIDFSYQADGTLSQKDCYYNPHIFGTTEATAHEYFDEKQRLVYSHSYITHGSLECYCIYSDDGDIPMYILHLDDTGQWWPWFSRRE